MDRTDGFRASRDAGVWSVIAFMGWAEGWVSASGKGISGVSEAFSENGSGVGDTFSITEGFEATCNFGSSLINSK